MAPVLRLRGGVRGGHLQVEAARGVFVKERQSSVPSIVLSSFEGPVCFPTCRCFSAVEAAVPVLFLVAQSSPKDFVMGGVGGVCSLIFPPGVGAGVFTGVGVVWVWFAPDQVGRRCWV